MRPALFLDRDGVVNEEINYLHKIEDVRWCDGIFDLCRTAKAKGYALVVITNQAGIGRGYYTEADFHTLMNWMKAEFIKQNCPLDGVYFCPHHPEKGQGNYKRDCDCRKPKPGMILQAAKELDIDLSQSLMVGDKQSDLQAAKAAGIPTRVFYPSGKDNIVPDEAIGSINSLGDMQQFLTQ